MWRALATLPCAAVPLCPLRCDELQRHPAAKHGVPVTSSVVAAPGFISQLDYRTRCPSFVLERLTRVDCFGGIDAPVASRAGHAFHVDARVPLRMQSRLTDFALSGYDRGHMAPHADHRRDDVAASSTFTLANVAPQHAVLNRQYWARVEKFARELVRHRFEEVFVITGTLFLPTFGEDGKWRMEHDALGNAPRLVCVPTHFYKVVLAEEAEKVLLLALVVPNEAVDEDTPLTHFLVPLEALEEAAGIIFFPDLLDAAARSALRKAEKAWLAPLLQPAAIGRVPESAGPVHGRRFRHLCDAVRCELPMQFSPKH